MKAILWNVILFSFFISGTVQAQEATQGGTAQPPAASTAKPPTTSIKMDPGEGVVQTVSSLENEMIGGIDWDKKIVYAVGDGIPPKEAVSPAQARVRAKRAAIDEAYARLLETVQELRVDAESTTRNFINENRVVQNRVSGLIRNAEIVEQRQFDDGSCQVKMMMPLQGAQGLYAALLPSQMTNIQQSRIVSETKRAEPAASQPPAAGATSPTPAPSTDAPAAYTGLIVDAHGLGVSPAAFPRIITQSGEVVYDLSVVDPNAATNGMCVYKKSLDTAKQVDRAGRNPLVVKAVETSGTNRVDLVLSGEDAKKVTEATTAKNFLRDAQVIVVID